MSGLFVLGLVVGLFLALIPVSTSGALPVGPAVEEALHSSKYHPEPEGTLETGVRAMVTAALGILDGGL